MRPVENRDHDPNDVVCRECRSWYFHKDGCSLGQRPAFDWTEVVRALNAMGDEIFRLSHEKGWLDNPSDFGPDGLATDSFLNTQVLLTHSELSEAVDELRAGRRKTWAGEGGKPEGFGVELIDALIRTILTAKLAGVDIGETFRQKHAYNMTRPVRHGGKKF